MQINCDSNNLFDDNFVVEALKTSVVSRKFAAKWIKAASPLRAAFE